MSEQEQSNLEPGEVEITVNSPKTDRSVSFVRNWGKDLEEAVQMFGAEVVHSIFVSQATIRAQGAARTVLDKDENGAEAAVQAGLSYTPGVQRKGGGGKKKDPFAVLADQIKSGKLSQEDLMAELQRRLSGEAA